MATTTAGTGATATPAVVRARTLLRTLFIVAPIVFGLDKFAGLLTDWLGGIILTLVTTGAYHDVALRDFGLLVAALSLAVLATPDSKEAA